MMENNLMYTTLTYVLTSINVSAKCIKSTSKIVTTVAKIKCSPTKSHTCRYTIIHVHSY